MEEVLLHWGPKGKKEATIQRTEVRVATDASPNAPGRDTLYVLKGQKAGNCAWSTFYKGKIVWDEAGDVSEDWGSAGICRPEQEYNGQTRVRIEYDNMIF